MKLKKFLLTKIKTDFQIKEVDSVEEKVKPENI